MENQSYSNYPRKWRDRFEFFDTHGAPGTAAHRSAFKSLPFLRRIRIQSNLLAFFFGPVYFLALGMWRKALLGFALSLGTFIVAIAFYALLGSDSIVADVVSRTLGLGMTLVYTITANYAYYLKEVKESNGWNIFEGLRF